MPDFAKHPNRQLLPLFRRLGDEFADFAWRGTALVHKDAKRIAGSLGFSPHFENKRWLSFALIPLFQRTEFSAATWGWRIPRNPKPGMDAFPVTIQGDEVDLDATIAVLRDEGLPNVVPNLEISTFYDFVGRRYEWGYLRHLEVHACAVQCCLSCLMGDAHLAMRHLEEAESRAQPAGWPPLAEWPTHRWERQVFALRADLLDANLARVLDQMDQWQRYTVEHLGIGDLVAPGFPGSTRLDR